jgi:hypothetical protein
MKELPIFADGYTNINGGQATSMFLQKGAIE